MKIITFYSDKGGVGNTMLNVSIASYLAFKLERKVCIIDTVGGHRNITQERIDEVEVLKQNPDNDVKEFLTPNDYDSLLKNCLAWQKLPIYKISEFENLQEFLKLNKKKYDYLFLDLKGMTEQNLFFIMKSHFIFLVSKLEDIYKDRKTFDAFEYTRKKKMFNLENLSIVLNNIYKNENYEERLNSVLSEKNLNVVDKIIYHRKSFSKYSSITGLIDASDEIWDFAHYISEIVEEQTVKA